LEADLVPRIDRARKPLYKTRSGFYRVAVLEKLHVIEAARGLAKSDRTTAAALSLNESANSSPPPPPAPGNQALDTDATRRMKRKPRG
jgi:hypothetical protein